MKSLKPFINNSRVASRLRQSRPQAACNACKHQQRVPAQSIGGRAAYATTTEATSTPAPPVAETSSPLPARAWWHSGRASYQSRYSSPTTLLASQYPLRLANGRALYSTQATATAQPIIHDLFETKTGTWQYVIADPSTLEAVIIDPVLDYDREAQSITTSSADSLLSLVRKRGYRVVRILETHAHADHLTAASYLQHRLVEEQKLKPAIGIGRRIGQVQRLFGQRYGVPEDERDGVFDKLFEDDECFDIGNLQATAIHLPGHTPDHLGYKIGDNIFCGDSLFHVDIGTARCDFPGGSANHLFRSGRRLLSLPDHVKIWTGHDYPPEGRVDPVPWMTVQDHKAQNKHLKDGITEEEFVAQRKERDAKLGEPKLLHQSLQTNIRAGRLPKPTASGHRMLRLPLKLGGLQW